MAEVNQSLHISVMGHPALSPNNQTDLNVNHYGVLEDWTSVIYPWHPWQIDHVHIIDLNIYIAFTWQPKFREYYF